LDFFACDVYDYLNSYTLRDFDMRTNIEIDDKLMDFVMSTGDFKTKREAVEAGLQMIKRRKAYDALLAARGTLFWDDSEEHWVKVRAERAAELAAAESGLASVNAAPTPVELAVHESVAAYKPTDQTATPSARKPRTATPSTKPVTKRVTKGAAA
jgi:Arc/MetJ family transcription regulator